jgi:hypothetical protein
VLTLSVAALYVLGGLLVLFLLFLVFLRLRNGRYARSLIARAAGIRLLRSLVVRSYIRDLQKTNPLAARAYAKLERVSGKRSRRHTEAALSVLTAAERRAYFELFYDQEPLNRAQRRAARFEKDSHSSGR